VSLSDAQLAALEAAGQLAVSREPEGGSPTGQPTGPVLVVSARLPIV
jgi:anti-sigma-K factor RskA